MRLIHTSDLHIGRVLHGYSLLDDQRHILARLAALCREQDVDGLIIAGDIYDKTQPSAQAVELLDEFFTGLCAGSVPLFIVCGNHDSPERLGFLGGVLRRAGVHISARFTGRVDYVDIGPLRLHLLPFLRPCDVRPYFPQAEGFDGAVAAALSAARLGPGLNLIAAHQFVTGAGPVELCQSESRTVGGVDEVSAAHFSPFDYVALGHLHGLQLVAANARYSGSPLKYSFSEARHQKSALLIDVDQAVTVTPLPLAPLRDLRVITGRLEQLTDPQVVRGANNEDYIKAVLTDPQALYQPLAVLRQFYPNLMLVERPAQTAPPVFSRQRLSPQELFSQFYRQMAGAELTEAQQNIFAQVWRQVDEENA